VNRIIVFWRFHNTRRAHEHVTLHTVWIHDAVPSILVIVVVAHLPLPAPADDEHSTPRRVRRLFSFAHCTPKRTLLPKPSPAWPQRSNPRSGAPRRHHAEALSEIDSFARLNLGDVYLTIGEVDRAREYFEATFQKIGNVDFFLARTRWKPRCLLGLGELWLRPGDLDKAEAFLADMNAHRFTAQFPFKKHQIRAARLRAGILAAGKEADAAIETLKTALGNARSFGNPTQLWKTHLALGDLLAENGKESQARPHYAAARKVVETVADGLTDPTLKGGFLRAPPIRAVLSKAQL
jgi:tetratricopeptide (TPR) repeat protein